MTRVRSVYVGGQESDRHALHAIVAGSGLADVRSESSPEALASLMAHGVDLLFVDLMQPSHDVLALMRAAATARPHGGGIPVIVVAPPQAADRIAACLARGADDYLLTPFDVAHPSVVVHRLQRCIERHHVTPPPAGAAKAVEATQVLPRNGTAPAATAPPARSVEQSDTVHRFIPREFLDLLAKRSLGDVALGDHVEREMTVFFSDIRDFTQLSESLTPTENFNFLTSYLRNVTPLIRQHGGFVDKYLGDGVMALFPGEPIQAVRATIALLHQLDRYNLGRRVAGYAPIRVGMGLHRGTLMLGTIGAEDQMQTTVIADAVNLASRIEGMTKTFGVGVLLSGSVVDALPAEHGFRLRGLGAVTAKGKSKSVEIYECYDNDPEELKDHKDRTARQFVVAMDEFRKGKLLTAGRVFARIAEMNRDDSVAAYFRDRCALSVVHERGGGAWDGAEHLEVK